MIVELEQDLNVYVYTGGEQHATGQPFICFIHGASMDHTVWTLFARYWAKRGYNIASIDLPGHGQSSGEPPETIEASAEIVCQLMGKLSQGSGVHWVGHSMGSLVALECARRTENSINLVMLGTGYPMKVGKPLLDSSKANEQMAIDIVSLFGHSFGSQLGGNPVAGVHAQTLAERLMEQAGDNVMYKDMYACHTYDQGEQAAAEVSCPVGLILGELDMMTPVRAAESLINKFSQPEVIRLSDCGHMMMSEKPELTHRALRRCIEAVAG